MTPEREATSAFTLAGLPGIGARRFRALIDRFGTAEAALGAAPAAFAAATGLTHANPLARRSDAARRAARITRQCGELGASVLVYGAPGYPPALGDLPAPPPVLFVLGRADLLLRRCVAIVGSRRATAYGRRVSRGLGASFAQTGRCVVSGMAMGIDAEAHLGALPGPTAAVLGSGVDVPSPPRNRALYGRILDEGGAIVSEFPPGAPAEPHHFPRRNRIIAALARDVIVVEASNRSGALITAEIALDLGRDVHAVPGPIDRATAAGANRLIADGAGVVLEIGPLEGPAGAEGRLPDEPELRELVLALPAAPVAVEEVAARTGRAPEAVAPLLTILEIRGFLTPTRDGRVMRTPGGA